MDKVRYGIIGVGRLGRHHLRWVRQTAGAELVGLYDSDAGRAEAVAGEFGCRRFSLPQDLWSQCDALSIVTPTTTHGEIALAAMAAGRHILVEKPIAATLSEADEMIASADRFGVKLAVGHIERFNPAVKALAGYNIRPSFIEAHRLAAFDPRNTDVAVILDLMIHDIDLALHLVKSPVVAIAASAVSVISDTEDIANARLTFANGAVANLTASRISLQAMRKLRIFQGSGYFSLDLAEKRADLYRLLDNTPEEGETALPLGASGKKIGYRQRGDRTVDMLGAEIQSFVDAVRGDGPVAVSGREGRDALEVALRIIDESKKAAGLIRAHDE